MYQNIFKCKHYTPNENMNKTCKNEKMCKIYYGEECKKYKEKQSLEIFADSYIKIEKKDGTELSEEEKQYTDKLKREIFKEIKETSKMICDFLVKNRKVEK